MGYLKAAGFTHIRVYSDRKLEEPREGEQRMYIKVRKGRMKSSKDRRCPAVQD